MASDRYVVLGLARPRAAWFRMVAQWANAAWLPAEFVKCVSAEELATRLRSGRAFSAVLVDGGMAGADRDLVHEARGAGCAVFVVDDGRPARDWAGLGVAAVLAPSFTREELLDALATHARLVGRGSTHVLDDDVDGIDMPAWRGVVATVCGPGGTGTSTVAAGLAQGSAADGRHGSVLLADLCLHAEQAMLHDVRDVVPGIQELVEAHRSRRPDPEQVRDLTFAMVERGYHLLLGLRRARYWSTMRPRSFEAAFETLRRTYDMVVCDVAADFEGEAESGAVEIEERNFMARTAAAQADVVLAVGHPGVKGLHSLVRVLGDLASLGVDSARVLPVINAAPRKPRMRAELAAALAELSRPAVGGAVLPAPLFLPVRRVEEAQRDGVRLPAALAEPLARAVAATIRRLPTAPLPVEPAPVPVVPGSLAGWSEEEAG